MRLRIKRCPKCGMPNILAIILLLVFANNTFAQAINKSDDRAAGIADGKTEAGRSYSAHRWFAYGFGGGLLLGPIGSGVVVWIGQSGEVKPTEDINFTLGENSLDYKNGFQESYSSKAKKKRLTPTIIGGVIGTATMVIILTSLFEKHRIVAF